jgi:hypothetical protein
MFQGDIAGKLSNAISHRNGQNGCNVRMVASRTRAQSPFNPLREIDAAERHAENKDKPEFHAAGAMQCGKFNPRRGAYPVDFVANIRIWGPPRYPYSEDQKRKSVGSVNPSRARRATQSQPKIW